MNTKEVFDKTSISLIGSKELYSSIRREVYNNMDVYYNPEISNEELSNRMKDIVIDKQCDYFNTSRVLKKKS